MTVVDLKLTLRADGNSYGLTVGDNGDFEVDEGLTTTLLVSILTDARAEPSEVSLARARRGWLGNLNFPTDGRRLGGKLWLIEQERRTTAALNKANDFTQKSLNWFVEDDIAKSVEVTGELNTAGAIQNVQITSLSGIVDSVNVGLWRATVDG